MNKLLPYQKLVGETGPQVIFSSLQFRPHFDHDFSPRLVHLIYGGQPIPMIIERVTPKTAEQLIPDESIHDLQSAQTPFILLVRSLEGNVHAASINVLVPENNKVLMRCDRRVKWESPGHTAPENVGLALLIATLEYMKAKGFWYEKGEILYNLIPEVVNSYRRKLDILDSFSFNPNLVGLALDGITAREGELFLASSPFDFQILDPRSFL